MAEEVSAINPKDVQRFVRRRVNASYNKQLFEEQLNDEIDKNLNKMQESIIKDMKRKMIIKNQQQTELQKRQNMKKLIEEKLSKSKQKRQNQRKTKQKNQSLQKSHRKKLYEQRISKLKRQQKQKIQSKLKQLHQKQMLSGPTYNKVSSAVSLIEEPHYKRKLQNEQNQYTRLKKMVEQKSAFKAPNIKKRQLSLTELKPRTVRNIEKQQQKINRMGEHLQKIEQTRRKKQNMLNQKLKNIRLSQQQAGKMRAQRLKLLLQAQKQRQQNIISKLSKTSISNSVIKLNGNTSSKKYDKIDKDLNYSDLRGSVIYEQGQQRQKYTYRKEIKQQIKQYMIKQKQKYLFAK